ncbi:MAG: AAA family ATPase, partial [Mycobacteriaceae bacterium]|nr:AAA family ATPase [Mycobacteriaceae bacterium]
MPTEIVSRASELQAVANLLVAARSEPSALMVEGEPGVGKTMLWLHATEQAREHDFRVLCARPSAVETVLSYAALSDMLATVDEGLLAQLPMPQRHAIDRIMLRASSDQAPTESRVVAAAFLSVVEGLAKESPVLIAIDDLQWMDASSQRVLAFAARRFSGRIALLCTIRTTANNPTPVAGLQLSRSTGVGRIRLGPLTLGALGSVITQRLGRPFPRPVMVRIHEISGGNPFYAIELACAIDGQSPLGDIALPTTLAELMHQRLGNLNLEVREALLVAACHAAPTVDDVARALRIEPGGLMQLLEPAENRGIVATEGNRLHF